MSNSHYSAHFDEHIDAEAASLDVSLIKNKAKELHRLFDNAKDSLLALMVFARKINVDLCHEDILEMSVRLLLPDENGKRNVLMFWAGRLVEFDVDDLALASNAACIARAALAKEYGVSEQDLIRYEKRRSDISGPMIHVPCNHSGCSMAKSISFHNARQMIEAEQRASSEIWYCNHHRESALKREGAISDEFLEVLDRIKTRPGLTQTESGAKRNDIVFLEESGLIDVEKVTQGDRLLCYRITLTDAGKERLARFNR